MSRFSMLAILAVGALPVLALPALAQTPPPASAAPPAATAPAPARPHVTLQQRFAMSNTTHDGHLTLAQAQAGMPYLARHFAEVDQGNKGYVTLDDIHAYYKARREARQQRLQQGPATPGSSG